jgi:hypothetical protein
MTERHKSPGDGPGGRAGPEGKFEGFGDAFNSPHSKTRESLQAAVPLAHSRIVFGPRRSFIYVEFCPLCGLEHVHGSWPLRGEGSDLATEGN